MVTGVFEGFKPSESFFLLLCHINVRLSSLTGIRKLMKLWRRSSKLKQQCGRRNQGDRIRRRVGAVLATKSRTSSQETGVRVRWETIINCDFFPLTSVSCVFTVNCQEFYRGDWHWCPVENFILTSSMPFP